MNEKPKLELEVLSGPLDGQTITIQSDSDWTRIPGSPLSFPWDDELGEPQARFVLLDEGWQLQPAETRRGTHLLRPDTEDRLPVTLQSGDILKASGTWLKIHALTP
jgi:hypothetical protein